MRKKTPEKTPYKHPRIYGARNIIIILGISILLTILIVNIGYYSGGTNPILETTIMWNWGNFILVLLIAFLFPRFYSKIRSARDEIKKTLPPRKKAKPKK